MIVQFIREFKHEVVDADKFKRMDVVETYSDPETFGLGYDIIEVDVLGIWEIKIRMGDGKIYVAEDAEMFKDGDEMKWCVTIWAQVECEN